MNYDKNQFKKYYGKSYTNRLKYTLYMDLAVILLIMIFIALGVTLPPILGFMLPGILFASIFVLIPIFFGQYTKAIRTSERQKQWFENDCLHVLIVPENGLVGSSIIEHTKEYIVDSVTGVTVNEKYIEISGDIRLIEIYNENKTEKQVTICKVPRNFTPEDEIFNLNKLNNINY